VCRESVSERNRSGSGSGNRIGRDEESVCGLESGSVNLFGLENDLVESGRGGFENALVGWVNEMVSGP